MREPVRRLDALTGLRFVAAAAVVVSHSKGRFGLPADLGGRVDLGAAGVTFFFVLSGFILAYVYPALPTPGAAGRFLRARFARVWPAHAVGAVAMTGVIGWRLWPPPAGWDPWVLFGTNLGLLHGWVPMRAVLDPYNAPSWSISTEFWFYVFFVALVPNWARTWWWKVPLTLAAPLAVVALVPALGLPAGAPYAAPNYETFLYYNPLARVYQFAVGMAAFRLWAWAGPRLRGGPAAGTALELLAAGLVGAALWAAADVAAALDRVPGVGHPLAVVAHSGGGLATGPFALLIVVLACGRGWVAGALARRPVVLLGEISFGVYVLHRVLLEYDERNPNAFRTLPPAAAYAGYWAVLLFFAHALWVGVERPARRLLAGPWVRRPGRPVPPAAGPARRRWLPAAAEVAVAAGVVVAGVAHTARATVRHVDLREAERLTKFTPPGLRDVGFGDGLRLRGAAFVPADGGVQVRLVWESMKAQPARYRVLVQATDPAGGFRAGADHTPDLGAPTLRPWQAWEQRLFLPTAAVAGAARVVLAVVGRDGAAVFPPAGGPRDAQGRLVLIGG